MITQDAPILKTIQILLLLFVVNGDVRSQDIPYGVNQKNGRYVNTGDAVIYYEVYGEGQPVVLLHGGFGYIDSFKGYIPILSKRFKVVAVASRGYGKSEIGSTKFSYDLLAEDVKKVIENEGKEKAVIIGHSDGAMISYLVASRFPEIVSKVVAMGGPLGTSGYDQEGLAWLRNFRAEEFISYRPDLIELMPQPKRVDEFIGNLKLMWEATTVLQPDDLRKIACPVLLLCGDRDLFCKMEHVVDIYLNLPNAQLAIFPNSTHSDISFRNTQILEQYVLQFMDIQ